MGNYHPHGDASIYDTLVRMAQDFNMRYPLVDGQGNFGSIDGDPPAAMRYTEARLKALADEMLADIDKETVDFTPELRRDDRRADRPAGAVPEPARQRLGRHRRRHGDQHPAAQPARGHRRLHLADREHALRRRRRAADARREAAQADRAGARPRFPDRRLHRRPRTASVQAYMTGRGSIMMRAQADDRDERRRATAQSIVVTEIPYQVNKARLIERIAELVREKTIEGISDIRDESDRDGMRIVIELKRGEMPRSSSTTSTSTRSCRSSFGIIMLAIVDGRPKVLTLLELIENFIEYRREVVRRRTEFELRKAEARDHILEGLKIALDHLDAVITLIRASKTRAEARDGLMTQFEPVADPGAGDPRHAAAAPHRPRAAEDPRRAGRAAEDDRAAARDPRERAAADADHRRRAARQVQEKYGDERRTEIIDGERASSASRT